MPDQGHKSSLDYLAQELTRIEENMVNPEDFGWLKAEVSSLRRDLQTQSDAFIRHSDKVNLVLQDIQSTLAEARGGWKLMVGIGGAAATVGGAMHWLLERLLTR